MFNRTKTHAPDPIAPSTRGPHARTLSAHLSQMSAIDATRKQLGERSAALVHDIERAQNGRAELDLLSRSIDEAQVAAAVEGAPAADLSPLRERLSELQTKQQYFDERAAIATKARDALAAKSEALRQNEYAPLAKSLNHLLLDALREDMSSFAPQLKEAEA